MEQTCPSKKTLRKKAQALGASPGRPAAKAQALKAETLKPAPKPVSQAKPSANPNQPPPDEEEEMEEEGGKTLATLIWTAPSWLTSTVLHVIVLVILALLTIPGQEDRKGDIFARALDNTEAELKEVPEEPIETVDNNINNEAMLDTITTQEAEDVPEFKDIDDGSKKVELAKIGMPSAWRDNLLGKGQGVQGEGIGARSDSKAKSRALADGGGSLQSEEAVRLGLEWLKRHQLPDGGWSYDHRLANHPNGENPGTLRDARNAATGMALMAFLGAGHTHRQGKYKEVVNRGLYFLTQRMKRDGSLYEPSGHMYGHGICAIALCEAYAMTQDKNLKDYAQASLNFIVAAQDPVGGGWRYQPRQPGDTSVVGWQLMALKSGHMAYLAVPENAIKGAINFLNIVQSDSGAKYGYTGPGGGAATTAIGLLCRMYTGWKKENGALDRGVEFLSKQGPSRSDMYYNYYATQVLHHWEGERWKKWNEQMRDHLINTQVKQGHELGSWFYNGGHGAQVGGRHYTTCMCVLTLEVYYRHLPIYRKQSTEDEFDK
ncbi:MAG: terpene cyclase/mutase family protein [Planctomycetia bacterium]|nr:terpene cyclase/mutase family protein [Planctomycetia bacterium]